MKNVVFYLIAEMKKKYYIVSLSVCCILLTYCFSGGKQQTEKRHGEIETLKITDIKMPETDVLNLPSYYLSAYYRDTTDWLYAYNYRAHALDLYDLRNGTLRQLPFKEEGPSAVLRFQGLHVCSHDSIWVCDETQRALLLDGERNVRRTVSLTEGLDGGQLIIMGHNYAMSSADLYYDGSKRSLLFCIKDQSVSPGTFYVREVFLDGLPSINHPLELPAEIPNVGSREYPYMGQPNVVFMPDKVLYNYPVESHVYVMDRASGKTRVFEANSNFTRNHVAACDWKTYADCERHRVENPHFYELRYLPDKDMYIRLHVDGQEFDATKDLGEMLARKKLYLTVFDNRFSVVGESELPSRRYDLFTGWITTSDALLLFVNNPLLEEEKGEYLEYDRIEW